RRHTSWPRDWSSDVCSSDLLARGAGRSATSSGRRRAATNVIQDDVAAPGKDVWRTTGFMPPSFEPRVLHKSSMLYIGAAQTGSRSEERRVGRGRRCGG